MSPRTAVSSSLWTIIRIVHIPCPNLTHSCWFFCCRCCCFVHFKTKTFRELTVRAINRKSSAEHPVPNTTNWLTTEFAPSFHRTPLIYILSFSPDNRTGKFMVDEHDQSSSLGYNSAPLDPSLPSLFLSFVITHGFLCSPALKLNTSWTVLALEFCYWT